MNKHFKLVLAASAALMLSAGFAVVASAQNMKVGLMLKKGFPGAAPVNGMYEFFKSEVEKGSGGKIKVDIVYGGALGKPHERLNQRLEDAGYGTDLWYSCHHLRRFCNAHFIP
jgi:TRAP-type C4-dicarboxylate transport system substrate-binding protein